MSRVVQIAIVDDDQGMRDALEDLVLSLGYRPRCFPSPIEFLADVDRADIACAIVDIKMPGMSGLELQEVLANEPHPLPIIILSSFADAQNRNKALSSGARCVLVKPVEDTALIHCIEAAVAPPS